METVIVIEIVKDFKACSSCEASDKCGLKGLFDLCPKFKAFEYPENLTLVVESVKIPSFLPEGA